MRTLKTILLVLAIMIVSTYTVSASPKVTADNTTFDILSGTYKLDGNVCVATNSFTVTADHAQVNLASFEVWAQDNITCVYSADDSSATPINFSGDDLYGSWGSKTITVKGDTQFKSGGLSVKADTTSFNWDTKIADFSGNVAVAKNGKTKIYSQIKYNVVDKKFLNDNGEEVQ